MDKTVAVFLAASILCAVQVFGAPAGVEPTRVLELPALPNNPLMRVSRDEGRTWRRGRFAETLDAQGRHVVVRTPLTLAISKDEGKTWINRRKLENDPQGWYCYFAVLERDDELFLGYGAEGVQLNHSRLTRVPLAWLSATSRER